MFIPKEHDLFGSLVTYFLTTFCLEPLLVMAADLDRIPVHIGSGCTVFRLLHNCVPKQSFATTLVFSYCYSFALDSSAAPCKSRARCQLGHPAVVIYLGWSKVAKQTCTILNHYFISFRQMITKKDQEHVCSLIRLIFNPN